MKWQKMSRPNGTSEIVSIIDRDKLRHWPPLNEIGYELSISWLCPIDDLLYVRVAAVKTRKRSGRIKLPGSATLIGYSSLVADAPICPKSGEFLRRAFYLREKDQRQDATRLPEGAVDPLSLLPGRSGKTPDLKAAARGYQWLGMGGQDSGLITPPLPSVMGIQ
jgi:hypothetical protein